MAPNTPLQIFINNDVFSTHNESQEAADVLRLAGLDPDSFDLFSLADGGAEEKVRDGQRVNHRASARFAARKKVHFTIDGQRYKSTDGDQTAAALLELAGLDPTKYDLARIVRPGGTQSFSDEEIVTITNGDEFVTAKQVGGVA